MIISKHKFYRILRTLLSKDAVTDAKIAEWQGLVDELAIASGTAAAPTEVGALYYNTSTGILTIGTGLIATPVARFLNIPEPDAFEGPGNIINLSFANTVTAGQPVVAGQIAGVTVHGFGGVPGPVYTKGEFTLSVKGVDSSGNAEVNVGDALYFVAEDTPPISKKNTGVLFGYALSAVEAGATATDAKVLLK